MSWKFNDWVDVYGAEVARDMWSVAGQAYAQGLDDAGALGAGNTTEAANVAALKKFPEPIPCPSAFGMLFCQKSAAEPHTDHRNGPLRWNESL